VQRQHLARAEPAVQHEQQHRQVSQPLQPRQQGIEKDPSAGCPDTNVLGRYAFTPPPGTGLRPLRDPAATGEEG
jgi:hypothetical protein